MNILIISDYFEPSVGNFLFNHVKKSYNRSGLVYERNLYEGFKSSCPNKVTMLCVPTCGTFPFVSRLFYSPKFLSEDSSILYVPFCNILYYRNISRYIHLKREVKKYIRTNKNIPVLVFVIQMHHPFMRIVKYIKKQNRDSKACLNIWDFPDYMNTNSSSLLKRLLKFINTITTYKSINHFDLLYFLTEGMSHRVDRKIPYIIYEGVTSVEQIAKYDRMKKQRTPDGKFHIVYTGKLTEIDGVLDLIDSVINSNNQNVILEIAGGGPLEEIVQQRVKSDSSIKFYGLLNIEETVKLQASADLFVLPRLPKTFTAYSFPSKVIEYLHVGVPILCHRLPCFNSQISRVLEFIPENDNSNLNASIEKIIGNYQIPDSTIVNSIIQSMLSEKIANEIITKTTKT